MRGHLTKYDGKHGTTWGFVVDVGRDPTTGRRRQKSNSGFRTRRLAERAMADFIHEVGQGTYADSHGMTLGEFLEQWFRDYARPPNVRARTAEGYRQIVKGHLIPRLGSIRLDRLTPADIQAYYTELSDGGRLDGGPGGLAPQTVRNHHRVLSEALRHAMRWGRVGCNVTDLTDPPPVSNKEPRVLTWPELGDLFEAARGTVYHLAAHLAAFMGLRRSEMLGLEWSDVDMEKRLLRVRRGAHRLRTGEMVVEAPKSTRGRRTLIISAITLDALISHRNDQGSYNGHGRVLAEADGTQIQPDSLSHGLVKLAKRTGIGHVTLQGLRHTHSTLLMELGVHPRVVQRDKDTRLL